MKFFHLILCFFVGLSLNFITVSCSHPETGEVRFVGQQKDTVKENLVKMNQRETKEEADLIAKYIERRNWKMEMTESGLRYMIYSHGDSTKHVKSGKTALIVYTLTLLDGSFVASVNKDKPLLVHFNLAEIPRGLEDGIMLMNIGDRARLIMHNYIGYGLTGNDRVPPSAILVYDVEVINK